MSTYRMATLAGAIVFLAVAALALYRLVVGFPITIGGVMVGQVATFFVLVVSAALSLILFRGSGGNVAR
jgi:hypothetical protein